MKHTLIQVCISAVTRQIRKPVFHYKEIGFDLPMKRERIIWYTTVTQANYRYLNKFLRFSEHKLYPLFIFPVILFL